MARSPHKGKKRKRAARSAKRKEQVQCYICKVQDRRSRMQLYDGKILCLKCCARQGTIGKRMSQGL